MYKRQDCDIATDFPKYRIYRHGELVEEVADVSAYWRDDLVSFVIGCSFSFESELVLSLIHISPTPASATPAKNPRRENGVLPNDSISHPFLCYGSIQNGNRPSHARNQARCRGRTQRILRMKRIAFITLSG